GFGPTETSVLKNTDDAYSAYIERNKHGILYFKNDYARALAYAKKQHKPLLVDFTGHACANCRKTEDYVWPDPQVTRLLNDNYVLVSLYVDDKRPLDPSEYDTVTWYGKTRIIRDIGDKFKYMEETRYGQSAQPLYVILNHAEEPLLPVRGYNADIAGYIKWLQAGIAAFKNSNIKP
ncbi:MAG: thioredoxin family protein, partial [Bacteroidia bacterium]